MNWNESESRIEASFGGRMDVAEMRVFAEELRDLLEDVAEQPYLVMIDHSKARQLDGDAADVLSSIKDFCLESGAERVVSVVGTEEDLAFHISARIQAVLEGLEDIVLQGREYIALGKPISQSTATVYELRRAA